MSNLFLVTERGLQTAPTRGVLPGITRNILMGLAGEQGVTVIEDPVHRDRLGDVREAFFSTSVRGVLPVVGIDGAELGEGSPGPVTRKLMEAYAAYCAREARPALSASGG